VDFELLTNCWREFVGFYVLWYKFVNALCRVFRNFDPCGGMEFLRLDMYLGNEVKKWYIDDSLDQEKPCWAMSSDLYVKRAISEVEQELGHVGQRLSTKVSTPMSAGYRPEVDGTKFLDD